MISKNRTSRANLCFVPDADDLQGLLMDEAHIIQIKIQPRVRSVVGMTFCAFGAFVDGSDELFVLLVGLVYALLDYVWFIQRAIVKWLVFLFGVKELYQSDVFGEVIDVAVVEQHLFVVLGANHLDGITSWLHSIFDAVLAKGVPAFRQ